MSERTTIGGTVYESIGSSSSNLLLKCNGTARIQWGGKLIDLIKNGKIASENSSIAIEIISDESSIKSDGIYVLNTKESSQLWIGKNGERYNVTGADLYISASRKQDITAEQQKQALENIGIYYNTLDDVNASGIQNGLVYVLETKNLYTIKDGVIEEFEAKLKTVTVEQNNNQGEVINNALKIVLAIGEDEYLILESNRIDIKKSVYVNNSVQIGSENADLNTGYRLYVNGDSAMLDIDDINLRKGSLLKHNIFSRGMIMMHSGIAEIPEGWAICDGNEYTYKGVTSRTPNLVNRFIKAVATLEEIKECINPDLNDANEFKLTKEHLPEHNHPHEEHTHEISEENIVINSSGNLALGQLNKVDSVSKSSVISTITSDGVNSTPTDVVDNVTTSDVTISGGDHTHTVQISDGAITSVESKEKVQSWENKVFKLEPNYYSLIFIMKL
jgi:hypothetical protein